ncbi:MULTISPECIES: DEAD/DEAH box helicase [unclassified Rhizobium]|uniref:DEAD/DEAH box helicase n=1 Tax=unclassified Rhizobium TaxID=2613769 RepID=UPI0012E36A0D|nr:MULTISPECIES: DEAD/DEAH box helicase [unclassified Rhizobium]
MIVTIPLASMTAMPVLVVSIIVKSSLFDWLRHARKEMVSRTGAILGTTMGLCRLPLWLLEALEVAEKSVRGRSIEQDWEVLARFRNAIQPGIQSSGNDSSAKLELSNFLRDLNVQLADAFSLSPVGDEASADFEIVPFSRQMIEQQTVTDGTGDIGEGAGLLSGASLKAFQSRVNEKGAIPAYRTGERSYLVVNRSAAPAPDVMQRMKSAPDEARRAFIQNPRLLISQAIEEDLRKRGQLEGLSPAQEQELIDSRAEPVLIETREYSERVTGKTVYVRPNLDLIESSGTTWLPEIFGEATARVIRGLPAEQLAVLERDIPSAIETDRPEVQFAGETIAATPATEHAVRRQREQLEAETLSAPTEEPVDTDSADGTNEGPVILETEDNYESLKWTQAIKPRTAVLPPTVPAVIRTPLKAHQVEGLNWQIEAWQTGLPGILNADEQGLGKTLQTIAFLCWLRANAAASRQPSGPVLVVAPTSLLENWEMEVENHIGTGGLGHLVRLYGSATGALKKTGARGMDTDSGESLLELGFLEDAIRQGRGHDFWVLTTYTTLTNYQHSLGAIPFSAVVFDEIQALKNPVSLRAKAGVAVNADFHIGLTGTPIENTTIDLWAIFEQLFPGPLGTLRDFRARFKSPDEGNTSELSKLVFSGKNGHPPMARRRLKEDVARDLPMKRRILRPRLMPEHQSRTYEDARLKLATGSRGGALKMLHHIRTVSVHPAITASEEAEAFIEMSARLSSCFAVLEAIRGRGERALVFIEHVQMQHRFISLVKHVFGLERVDLINGSTPIHRRQEIVNRFQRHLGDDRGFDLLVLGPKAAGTGLTLTAATHVIHLSRWWNPAVEEQCNDRVHRIGQTKPVTVHMPMAIHPAFQEHSFDCLLNSLMTKKRNLAKSVLWPMGDTDDDADQLQAMLKDDTRRLTVNPLENAMAAMFKREGAALPELSRDGGYEIV